MKKKFFISAIMTIVIVMLFGFTPAAAQSDFPQEFCENTSGRVTNAGNPLPVDGPCSDGTTYEVVSYESKDNPGVFASEATEFSSYDEMYQNLLSGIIWAIPGGETGEADGSVVVSSECMLLDTRDERLICLDVIYDASGFEAWLDELGTMDVIHDARQPDEYHPVGNPETVRGLQVDGTGTLDDPRSCVTTDVPARVTSYTVKYQIPGAGAALYGGVVSFNGEVSVWADCTDWPEFATLLYGEVSEPDQRDDETNPPVPKDDPGKNGFNMPSWVPPAIATIAAIGLLGLAIRLIARTRGIIATIIGGLIGLWLVIWASARLITTWSPWPLWLWVLIGIGVILYALFDLFRDRIVGFWNNRRNRANPPPAKAT